MYIYFSECQRLGTPTELEHELVVVMRRGRRSTLAHGTSRPFQARHWYKPRYGVRQESWDRRNLRPLLHLGESVVRELQRSPPLRK